MPKFQCREKCSFVMEKKRSSRNPHQIDKSQLNCMWGLISSLYFGQNQRKQKLLSNGKGSTKNVIGMWLELFDSETVSLPSELVMSAYILPSRTSFVVHFVNK